MIKEKCPNPECENGYITLYLSRFNLSAVRVPCKTCHGSGSKPKTKYIKDAISTQAKKDKYSKSDPLTSMKELEDLAKQVMDNMAPYEYSYWDGTRIKASLETIIKKIIPLIEKRVREEIVNKLDACIKTRREIAETQGTPYNAGKVAGLLGFKAFLKGEEGKDERKMPKP